MGKEATKLKSEKREKRKKLTKRQSGKSVFLLAKIISGKPKRSG